MTTGVIDMGTISSRGQVAIPSEIRNKLRLEEGSKVLFLLENDVLIMKKITSETFKSITEPLKKATKKISEDKVVNIVHKIRKNNENSA